MPYIFHYCYCPSPSLQMMLPIFLSCGEDVQRAGEAVRSGVGLGVGLII